MNFNPDKVILDGGDGNDELVESTGANFELVGGNGNDSLEIRPSFLGGSHTGKVTGGTGFDTFVLDLAIAGWTNALPTINDFTVGQDHFSVGVDNFGGGLVAGVLNVAQLGLGVAATTVDQRFIYDNATGALYFDQDGNGVSAQVKLAIIGNLAELSAADFIVT